MTDVHSCSGRPHLWASELVRPVRDRHVRRSVLGLEQLDIAIADSGRRRTAPHAGSGAGPITAHDEE